MVDRDRTLVEVAERLYFVDVDGTRLITMISSSREPSGRHRGRKGDRLIVRDHAVIRRC